MKIAVIGTGYVGLVSGACFSEFGFDVTCVDNDPDKIARITAGDMPIYEPGLADLVGRNAAGGRLHFTTDLQTAVAAADAVFIAVGTPTRRGDGHADLSFVYAVARELAPCLQGYTVVITKSTVPVGTGREVAKIIASTNLDLNIDYFVCEDNHVIYDNLEAIKFLPTKNKFVPDKYFNLFNEEDNINFMPTNWDAYFKSKATYENPNFSLDVSKEIFVGQTVTYLMLQLIYYMGFETTYIVGLDFSYTIPKNVRIDNNSIDMDSDDPNHFFGDYFGKGKQWHFPKLDSCMQSYILANNRFRSANRTIVDATKGGKLNVFHKSETIQGINIHSSSDNCLEFERYVEDYFNGLNAKKQFVKLINSQEFFANSNDIDDNEVAIYYHGLKRGYQLDKSILLSSNIPGFSWFDSTLPIKYLDIASSEVNDNAVTESTIIGLRICRFNSKSKELVRNCDLKGMTGIRLEKMIYFAKI